VNPSGIEPQPTTCPHCGRRNVLHSHLDPQRRPTTGSTSICWKCRGIAIFVVEDGVVAIRLPTAEEDARIRSSPSFAALIKDMLSNDTPSAALRRARREAR
jgi:hypothetical protein